MNKPDGVLYFQLGARICVGCYNTRGVLVNITMDMGDSKALGREVRTCSQCGVISIGEPNPPKLQRFFNDHPEDPPEHERVVA